MVIYLPFGSTRLRISRTSLFTAAVIRRIDSLVGICVLRESSDVLFPEIQSHLVVSANFDHNSSNILFAHLNFAIFQACFEFLSGNLERVCLDISDSSVVDKVKQLVIVTLDLRRFILANQSNARLSLLSDIGLRLIRKEITRRV